jgi:hypothetical protein
MQHRPENEEKRRSTSRTNMELKLNAGEGENLAFNDCVPRTTRFQFFSIDGKENWSPEVE